MPRVVPITSRDNALLKVLRRAARQGVMPAEGDVLVETPRLLEEAQRSGLVITAMLATPGRWPELEQSSLGTSAERVHLVSDTLMAEISTTETSPGVLGVVSVPQHPLADLLHENLLLVLDGMQDPGNLGAVLRVAEAFGVGGVILTAGSANPYASKAVRASAGSLFRVKLCHNVAGAEVAQAFAGRRTRLWAAEPHAKETLDEVRFQPPLALAIGNESRGLSGELRAAASLVRIPTQGVESLNAAVAAGILLYAATRRQGGPGRA